MAVHVLTTTEEGTRCALLAAKRLADGFRTRIVLLVPKLTSDAAPSDPTGNRGALTTRQYEALASSVGVDADVIPCVCWRPDDVLHGLLGRSSLVVIGGRRNRAWPSPERRLANRLAGEGYPVVFAEIGAESVRAAWSSSPGARESRTSSSDRASVRGGRFSCAAQSSTGS